MSMYWLAVADAARQELRSRVKGEKWDWGNPYYHLAGPVPHAADPEVEAIAMAAQRRGIVCQLESGLVMRLSYGQLLLFVTFYETNAGTHRLYEVSGDGQLFTGSHPHHGPDQLQDLLAYLDKQGVVGRMRPAAPLPN